MKLAISLFITLCSLILVSLMTIKNNFNSVVGKQNETIDLNLTLQSELVNIEIDLLIDKIETTFREKNIFLKKITPIKANEQFNEITKYYPNINNGLFDENELSQILQTVLVVQLKNISEVEKVKILLGDFKEIIEINSTVSWFEKIQNFLDILNIIFSSLIFVFFSTLVFLQIIFTKNHFAENKDSLLLKSLLGASPFQAIKNILIHFSILTLISYIIGSILSVVILYSISNKLNNLPDFMQIHNQIKYFHVSTALQMTACFVLTTLISGFITYQNVKNKFYENN